MAAWLWFAALFCWSQAAVLPPPWADVKKNPCASHPRGWLMLYWPTDGKCYTIYKKGHPCPDTQELSPGRWGGRTIAECKCPPGTAQLPLSTTCYRLFERGPCRPGEYFAPVEESFNKRGERQGMCVRPQQCADETLLHWPADGRCYYRLSQGPCYPGSILDVGSDGIANCTCASDGPHYWAPDGGCYAHYSRGPCERGQLFLPGGRCGCEDHLPHYHNGTRMCYELDTLGPCPKGHTFSISEVTPQGSKAECQCKPFHARADDGACYRLYTRGPCANDEMISRGGRCIKVPCARGRLYVPARRRCYRPGAAEPCPRGELLAFDFDARPALDGLSHNGVCACAGTGGSCARREVPCARGRLYVPARRRCYRPGAAEPCPRGELLAFDFDARPALDGLSHNGVCACAGTGGSCARREVPACHTRRGAVAYGGACHTLHTQGPCPLHSWLVRAGAGGGAAGGAGGAGAAACRCRPGHRPPDCRPDTAS